MVELQDSVSPEQRKQMARQEQDVAVETSLGRIKNKIIVMSGKGGVGKSSTTVNLAVALAEKGHRVGIMDVDLHGPDIPRMLGLQGNLDLSSNQKLNPAKYSENLRAVSIESLTPSKDDAIIWRGPIKFSAIKQFIGDVEWGELDFLLIDAPPGTGDEPLTVAPGGHRRQVDHRDHAPGGFPGRRAKIHQLLQDGENGDFRPDRKHERLFLPPLRRGDRPVRTGGAAKKPHRLLASIFLGRVPFDPTVVSCGDKGQPLNVHHADSAVAKAFDAIAEKVSSLA